VRVGGPADLFTTAKDSAQLEQAARWALSEGVDLMVLGSGSNVVIGDGGFRGLVIKSISRRVEVLAEDERGVRVELDAGTFLPTAAKRLAEQGVGRMAWGVGIPGTAGGAVVGNAGAYGGVTADTLEEIDGLTPSGELVTVPASELRFVYRSSAIKRGDLLLPVVLRVRHVLRREDPEPIKARIKHLLSERKRKQPVEPSVGSTFKNPPDDYAGAVIERLGLKGMRVGGAQISPKHANYVINTGDASAADVRALVAEVRRTVLERAGLELEVEIEFKGER
jgi:UDP-N-acetylmuramate dehydrogenase